MSRYLATLLVFGTVVLSAAGDVVCPEPQHDAGVVRSGRPLTHEFHVRNRGTTPVELMEPRASCGCVASSTNGRVLQPGAEALVSVSVNTLTQSAGDRVYRVTLPYRLGGDLRETSLDLKARIEAEITVQPAAVTMSASKAVPCEIRLSDLRDQPFRVRSVESSSPELSAEVVSTLRDAEGATVHLLRVQANTTGEEGRHEAVVVVHTDDAVHSQLRIPVTVVRRSRARVSVHPAQAEMRVGRERATRMLMVRGSDGERVEIERVVADDPSILCTWSKGNVETAAVKLAVDGSQLLGELRTRVRIELAGPVRDVLDVDVVVTRP